MKIPSIGPSREVVDKLKKDIDSFINYLGSLIEFYMNLYKPGLDAFEDVSKKSTEIFSKGDPDEIKEYYIRLFILS